MLLSSLKLIFLVFKSIGNSYPCLQNNFQGFFLLRYLNTLQKVEKFLKLLWKQLKILEIYKTLIPFKTEFHKFQRFFSSQTH